MFWESNLLMTLVDLFVLGAAGYLVIVYRRHRAAAVRLGFAGRLRLVLVGLLIPATLYGADLLTMWVLPSIVGEHAAMALMIDLHLNWSWLAVIGSTAALLAGLSSLLSELIPKVTSSLTSLEETEALLRTTQGELEQRIGERTRELEASERRFRDFARAAGDWYWETDAEHRFTYISESFTEITGIAIPPLLGLRRVELAAGTADQAALAAHLEDLEAHRPFRDFTYTVTAPDGTRFDVRTDGTPIFDDADRFIGYRGSAVDMTATFEAGRRLRAAESRLAAAIERVPDPCAVFDREDRLVIYNQAYTELNRPGLGARLRPGTTYAEIARAMAQSGRVLDARGREEEWLAERLARHAEPPATSLEMAYDGGCWLQILETRTPDGDTVLLARDISVFKANEKALRESEQRFRILYDENPCMCFTFDPDGTLQSVNRFGAEQLGYRADALAGMPFVELHQKSDRPFAAEKIAACLARPNEPHSWEIRKRRRDGSGIWVRETARVIEQVDGARTILAVCEDISEARELSAELSYQAAHDPLTNLVNRREFERRLQRVVDASGKDGSQHALCYIDLDQFKVINDTCGHVAGDELLRQLAKIMSARVRRRDTLARLGGDEFGILMEHCAIDQARRVAANVVDAIGQHRFIFDEKVFTVGSSVGLVSIDTSTSSAIDVLAAADSACYAAKDQGRNRIHLYHPEDADLMRRHGEMQWVARINGALEEDRLRLYAQPIAPVSGSPHTGAYFELLLRLAEADGEIVAPGTFLPAAERYGLTSRIDRWVVSHALAWLGEFSPETLHRCCINLSGQSIGDESFLDFCLARLAATRVVPQKLCFEITETAVITNLNGAERFISRLRELGVRFALDDFGSGLSSFAYLKTLDVDYLKIDGLFVRDVCVDPVDREMVKSINDIGHIMGKQTIAEFVEDEAVLSELRVIGVDYAQGFALGRPQPIAPDRLPEQPRFRTELRSVGRS